MEGERKVIQGLLYILERGENRDVLAVKSELMAVLKFYLSTLIHDCNLYIRADSILFQGDCIPVKE